MSMKFTKIEAGWYATEDGRYAVVIDGYKPSAELRDQEFITGGEWATVFDGRGGLRENHNAGENLDWFSTKREAVAHAEYTAAARERFNAAINNSSPKLWREGE